MRLALFDFDGTLTTRDSLMPFLRHSLGTSRFINGLISTSPILTAYALKLLPNDVAKQRMLKHFIGGTPNVEVERWGRTFALGAIEPLLRPAMMEKLAGHRASGDTCVLVSASLSVYLEPWARAQGFDATLCSRLTVDSNGAVTGTLQDGNCFGPEKLKRIEQWLNGRVPDRITAYGDSRGDREMLNFAHEAHWINGSAR